MSSSYPALAPYPWIVRRRRFLGATWLTLIGVLMGLIGFGMALAGELTLQRRIDGEMDSFVADLLYARAEASQRGRPIAICASNDGTTCAGTNDWERGWIVFRDIGDNGVASAGSVLRRRSGWSGTDTFRAGAATSVLRINESGMVHGLADDALTLTLHTVPGDDDATRCVTLNRVGHHQLLSHGTGACR